MQLFLSAEGRTSTLDVDGALTVGQLKDVIEDESFIPADLQRLTFAALHDEGAIFDAEAQAHTRVRENRLHNHHFVSPPLSAANLFASQAALN